MPIQLTDDWEKLGFFEVLLSYIFLFLKQCKKRNVYSEESTA